MDNATIHNLTEAHNKLRHMMATIVIMQEHEEVPSINEQLDNAYYALEEARSKVEEMLGIEEE